MAKPLVQLNQKIDEPDITKDMVVAPDIAQDIVVAPTLLNLMLWNPLLIKQMLSLTPPIFFKAEKYNVQDDLIDWCKCEAAKARFTIVIEKSDNNSDRKKKFFVISCERGIVYKEPKRKLKKEDTATRKCKCPFRL
jgi:hypothetical protein